MATLIHLSDIHLVGSDGSEVSRPQYELRVRAIARALRAALRGETAAAVFITGDIFDTSIVTAEHVRIVYEHLTSEIRAVVGKDAPILALPGNHDRRSEGLVKHAGPVVETLRELAKSDRNQFFRTVKDAVTVMELPGLPYPIVLYDSSYLEGGLISAGGTVRASDVMAVFAQLDRWDPKTPLIWAHHHHLVPTPVTDLEVAASGRFEGRTAALVKRGLWLASRIVSNVDREETTMTALGAGSMLAALHSLRRPVLLLHGHKHYPTVRALRATREKEGDVILLSAGSAGVAENYVPTGRSAAIWPNFNIIRLETSGREASVDVELVAFPPATSEETGAPPRVHQRHVLNARSMDGNWAVRQISESKAETAFASNQASIELKVNDSGLVDLFGVREIVAADTPRGRVLQKRESFQEVVEGMSGGRLSFDEKELPLTGDGPSASLTIGRGGTGWRVEYTITNAIEDKQKDPASAYEWVGLPVAHTSASARLDVVLHRKVELVFGSVTDLSTGREAPRAVQREGLKAWFAEPDCQARSLLRIYWRIQDK